MVRNRQALGCVMASLLVVGVPAAAHAQMAVLRPVPDTNCSVFPADNIWNTRVDSLPVHPDGATWLASMHAGSTNLHPDFGPPSYGLPYDVVSNRHRTVRIRFRYASESDRVRYPFGPRIPIENGSDRHALIVNKSTCMLYELFDADWNHGNPTAGSGAVFDLSSNVLRPDGWTSADAAGLPILAGLVRFDEVKAGSIGHAIRFTAQCTWNRHVWPARHDAGTSDQRCPPMGARFRLKSGFDLSRFSPKARVVLRAMKRYGLIVADNGSDWYFQGTRDRRWRNALLDQLKTVPASAFEAVDVSSCTVDPDSAQASCP
ncbi:MAG TPA: hypothetical protein VGK11_04545 [Actinomycetota bacterium]|jgi:hypothetical protein